MAKVTIDRALIEQAVDVINSECGYGGSNSYEPRAIAEALRAALAEPAVEPVAEVVMAMKPPHASPAWLPFKTIYASLKWLDSVPVGTKLYTSPPPPAQPVRTSQDVCTVPLLSDEEIHGIYDEVARSEPYSGAVTRRNVARAIEQAVRRKAGL